MRPRRATGVETFYARLVDPVIDARRRKRGRRYVSRYERFFALPPPKQQALRRRRLRLLLVHAFDSVPFHRDRMQRAGVDPRRAEPEDVLAGLPPLERGEIRENLERLLSSAFRGRQLHRMASGGTTSAPVHLMQNPAGGARKNALTTVFRRRMGWHDGASAAFLWAATRDLPAPLRSRAARVKRDVVFRWVDRTLVLPADVLGPERLDAHAERLAAFRPHVLQGYPSATTSLARRLLATGRRLSIPLVVLTAEPVLASQRRAIAEATGARVLSFYGAREHGWIAWEDPATGEMVVNTAGLWLETDATGDLLVTDLLNHAMPLLRYRLGDRVRLARRPGPEGAPRDVVEAIEGRTGDDIVLPSGRVVPASVADVRAFGWDPHGVVEAQFVQHEPDAIDVNYVAARDARPERIEAFRATMARVFEGELRIRMHRREAIEPGPNGKVRWCVSTVARP